MQIDRISFKGKLSPTTELKGYIKTLPAAKFDEFKSNVLNLEKVKDSKTYTFTTRADFGGTNGVLEEKDCLGITHNICQFFVGNHRWYELENYVDMIDNVFTILFEKYPEADVKLYSESKRNLNRRKNTFLRHLGFNK